MRSATHTARARLQRGMYREARRDAVLGPAAEAGARPRIRARSAARAPRRRRAAPGAGSQLTALALLGLLDLLERA